MWFRFSLRNFLRQKRRTFFTVAVICIGYLILSLSFSIAEGSYNQIIKKFTEASTGHIQIHKKGYLENNSFRKTLPNNSQLDSILSKNFPNILRTKRIIGEALAYHQKKSTPVLVKGILPQQEDKLTSLTKKITTGRYFSQRPKAKEIIVGSLIAKNLKLKLGSEVILVGSGYDRSIANDIFYVVGILEHPLLNSQVLLSFNAAQDFFSLREQFHEIMLVSSSYKEADLLKEKITASINSLNLEVSTWKELEKEFYLSMEADKKGNYVVSMIIIFLVLMVVMNTLMMAFYERRREFGVMISMGTPFSKIFFMILLEVKILTFCGVILGLLTAVPIGLWFSNHGILLPEPIEIGCMMFQALKGEVSFFTLAFPALCLFIAAMISLVLPCYEVFKLTPSQCMRDM